LVGEVMSVKVSFLDGQLEGDVHLSFLGQRDDFRKLYNLRAERQSSEVKLPLFFFYVNAGIHVHKRTILVILPFTTNHERLERKSLKTVLLCNISDKLRNPLVSIHFSII